MFCTNCGRPLDDGSQFCIHCGARAEISIPVRRGDIQRAGISSSSRLKGSLIQQNYGQDNKPFGQPSIVFPQVNGTNKRNTSEKSSKVPKKHKKWPVMLMILCLFIIVAAAICFILWKKSTDTESLGNEQEGIVNAQTLESEYNVAVPEFTDEAQEQYSESSEGNFAGNQYESVSQEIALEKVVGIIGSYYAFRDKIVDSYGNEHTNVLEITASEKGIVSYQVNGNYEIFAGNIVLSQEASSEAKINLAIFADDVLIYEVKGMTKQQDVQPFCVDISGVRKVDIKTEHISGYNEQIYITDGKMLTAKNNELVADYSTLRELIMIDGHETELSDRLFSDAFGNLHSASLRMNAYDDGYAVFNLDNNYTDFTAEIVTGRETNGEAIMNIQCYLDDVLIAEFKDVNRMTEKIPIILDVTNAKVLKIISSASQQGYMNDTLCYIVDDKLIKK